MISYIVSVDNRMELLSNFIGFLKPNLLQNDEVIFILDGCDRITTYQYINALVKCDSRFHVIELKEKSGFAHANNLGVAASSGEILAFINTDIFLTLGCVTQLEKMLNSSPEIAAVQPLLLYPQSGRVQSTGHVFSKVKSGQLFSMRDSQERIVQMSSPRQALTMALCLMKRDLFYKMGGFNEEYYNSHEGMELTLKLSLSGYKCMYCAQAIAYHCGGAARNYTAFDISRQRAYFYQQWGNRYKSDLEYYLSLQYLKPLEKHKYIVYNVSSSTDWARILDNLRIHYSTIINLPGRFDSQINLYDQISFTQLHYPAPYLFLCNNFTQIQSNRNWIENRNNSQDMVLDLDGNLLELISIVK